MVHAKIIYAQSRQAGVTRTGFLARWREHGAVAMQQPDFFGSVLRYVQADVIDTATTGPGDARSYDGVGEIVYPSRSDLDTAYASPGLHEVVAPHGATIFGSPHPLRMVADEHVAWCDHRASAKLYVWVRRPEGETHKAFQGRWAASCMGWATDAGIRARVRSYVRDVPADADSDFDGIEETTFDTFEAARTAMNDPAFLVRSLVPAATITILAQQVVLLDTTHFG